MDQQLKTRLIGVTIVVSLVVIFVPMLFEDGGEGSGANVATSAPDFPQAFDSQTLPLPSAQSQINTIPSGTKGEGASPTMRDEPLDPLDIPPASAGTQADEIDAHDASADAQDALMPEKAPAKGAELRVAQELSDDFAPANRQKPGMVAGKPPTQTAPGKPLATLLKPAPLEKPAAPPATTATPAPATKPPASAAELHAGKTKDHAGKDAAVKMTAWVIQAGSFADEANAKTVLVKLRQAKINAFVEMIPGPGGNAYRVRVGPELDRAKAEAVLKKMETDAGVKGMIVSYP